MDKDQKRKASSRYVFCEIPNDEEGRAFVEGLKKYFNKDRYKLRVRGQYYNEFARKNYKDYPVSAPIGLCTHLRVYIDDHPRVREAHLAYDVERTRQENTPIATARRLQREMQYLWLQLVNKEAKIREQEDNESA